tara:strand:+ start:241 stop:363 length:123 start_codon:yes stop_codon:yes gene_type:complete
MPTFSFSLEAEAEDPDKPEVAELEAIVFVLLIQSKVLQLM